MTALSRRRFLGALAGGALGGATAGVAGTLVATAADGAAGSAGPASDLAAAVPFDGQHQAGITTPAQDRLHFVSYDVTTSDLGELRDLLAAWTDAARTLTRGRPVGETGALDGPPAAPPEDTGEALDLPPAALTVTLGLGGSLFDDRFGLRGQRPAALVDLPAFPLDDLDPGLVGGDLCLQVCAHDEQVAFHAARQLGRIGAGVVAPRYVQRGWLRASGPGPTQPTTPRNLFGFKDGTANPAVADAAAMRDAVWVQPGDGPAWMAGGSYLVTRAVRMMIETWDRTSLAEQEAIIGRHKGSGAPLGGRAEHDAPDLTATAASGDPVIPATAHVRLAHPDRHGGARLLRRGYSFANGLDRQGRTDAGLFFMAYQRDPRRAFVPVQSALARSDALNEYVEHVGSGVWACPPGPSPDRPWAAALLGG